MGDLVVLIDNKMFTTSVIIAEKTNNTVHSVRELIKTHKVHLEKFGVLSFEMRKPDKKSKGGRPQEIYFLNEDQTTLLLTFMRNSEIVIDFKVKLVQEFSKGMEKEMFYKDIYQMAKQRVEIFASVMPKTQVPMIESIENK